MPISYILTTPTIMLNTSDISIVFAQIDYFMLTRQSSAEFLNIYVCVLTMDTANKLITYIILIGMWLLLHFLWESNQWKKFVKNFWGILFDWKCEEKRKYWELDNLKTPMIIIKVYLKNLYSKFFNIIFYSIINITITNRLRWPEVIILAI